MSGDIQTRKRKDKKRKKEDSTEQLLSQVQSNLKDLNEDVNIHVHKEHGTGGGICAKIVFFLLFSALAVLIGLIITEHRGLTDLDNDISESKFSQLFEGWIDTNTEHNSDEHMENSLNEHISENTSHDVDNEDDDHDEEDQGIDLSKENEDAIEEDDESEEEHDQSEDDEDVEELEDIEEGSELEESEDDLSVEEQSDQDVNDGNEENEESIEMSKTNSKEDAEDSEETFDAPTLKMIDEENEGILDGPQKLEEEETINEEVESKKSRDVNVENEESDSDKQSIDDVEVYEYENITNQDDKKIKDKLDEAQKTIQNNAAYAIQLFDVLLEKYPSSPRSLYGKALALDFLADQKRSNQLLQQAITTYIQGLNALNVPNALFEMMAERCINRMRFLGQYNNAVNIHKLTINRFFNEPKYKNQLAVTYLTMNNVNNARQVLKEVLAKYPNDGVALVHYGFILKTNDNNLKDAVYYMQRGLQTQAPGVVDGRFYFHLGDALARLGRPKEAMEVYEEGVSHKLFLSKYQRSLYNVPRLKQQPWWSRNDLESYSALLRDLEDNWRLIRAEGLSVLNENGLFQKETENLRDTGDWRQFELFARGQKNSFNCKKCPATCRIIEAHPGARGCRRGQTKFSVMHPGTHVWPHCGPTNCRLRMHLGLKVPTGTFIRVTEEIRSWIEGEVIVFDDSFEHEVWHNGTEFRLVLIVDVWHPELTAAERKTLTPI